MEETSRSGEGRMAVAHAITFEEFEDKAYAILWLENRIRRLRRAIAIYLMVKLIISLCNKIIKKPPAETGPNLLDLLDRYGHLRKRFHSLIFHLRDLQKGHRFLFRDSLFEELENIKDHFDNEVETLQLAIDPEIKEGINKAILNIERTKEDREPWRDSLAKI